MCSVRSVLFALLLIGLCALVRGGDNFPFLPPGDGYLLTTPLPSTFTFGTHSINDITMHEDNSTLYLKHPGGSAFIGLCCSLAVNENSGSVRTRTSNETTDLQKVQELARQYELFGSSYSPQWVFMATWDDVGVGALTGGYSFQIIIAVDGQKSFLLFDFKAFPQWDTESKFIIQYGYPAPHYFLLKEYNLTLTSLPTQSNINEPGHFLFRVDGAQIGLPVIPTPPPPLPCGGKCRGVCVKEQCLCNPNDFFSISKDGCVSPPDCGFCGKVGSYTEYPGVWWEGPEKYVRTRFTKANATTARVECEAQCSADPFCVAFRLKSTGVDTTCTLLPSFFETGEFKYNQDNVNLFHKKCV